LQSSVSTFSPCAVSASSQFLLSSSSIIIQALSGTFQSSSRIGRLIRHVAGSAMVPCTLFLKSHKYRPKNRTHTIE
jgi:hypothetical protein